MNKKASSCSLRECSSLPWYTSPEDHRSPHDCWVQSITVSEPSSGERREIRGVEIHISLLGAYHDGTIEFTYQRVQRYSLEGIRDTAGHGDWLEDELKLRKNNSLLHKVTLTNENFEIEAEEIEYRWTPLPSLSVPPASER
jgi:hypothetical protein